MSHVFIASLSSIRHKHQRTFNCILIIDALKNWKRNQKKSKMYSTKKSYMYIKWSFSFQDKQEV